MRKTGEAKNLWAHETEWYLKGYETICGIDEAGLGPLAGPVCAGAVILRPYVLIEGLDDSKKLTQKVREKLFDIIIDKAFSATVGMATVEEIDGLGIAQAKRLAVQRAIEELNRKPDLILIDGKPDKKMNMPCPCSYIVKGDSLSANIAAASIIAKVTRDRYMTGISKDYSKYGFEKHKGYGTKEHIAILREYGPSDMHRMTFKKVKP